MTTVPMTAPPTHGSSPAQKIAATTNGSATTYTTPTRVLTFPMVRR